MVVLKFLPYYTPKMMPMNSYETDDVIMMMIMMKMLSKLLPDCASIWSFVSVFTQHRIYDYLLDTNSIVLSFISATIFAICVFVSPLLLLKVTVFLNIPRPIRKFIYVLLRISPHFYFVPHCATIVLVHHCTLLCFTFTFVHNRSQMYLWMK